MREDEIAEMVAGLGPAVLLKADAVSAPAFAGAGCTRCRYDGRAGRPVAMPYRSIPDEAFDDPDAMARWVRLAYEAALRAGAARHCTRVVPSSASMVRFGEP